MNNKILSEVVTFAFYNATAKGTTKRNKVFSEAYARVESLFGKAALTDEVKASLRNMIDEQFGKKASLLTFEKIVSETSFCRVKADLSIEFGRKLTVQNFEEQTKTEEMLKAHGLLLELRSKIAGSRDGCATESQLNTIRRFKNAINTRLFELHTEGKLEQDEQAKKVKASMERMYGVESGKIEPEVKGDISKEQIAAAGL